jgi:dephospho-CoA kinase
MKLVIGIVGEKGSGKETIVNLLRGCLSKYTISHVRSSDILTEVLKIFSLPHSRSNLQNLAIAMDRTFGEGTLTHAVSKRIESLKSEIVIFDGVRWQSDAKMIKKFPKNILIYITAPLEQRYHRTKARKEKTGEAYTTLEKFSEEEKAETELDIRKIGETADIKIDNSGSYEELTEKIEKICCSDIFINL